MKPLILVAGAALSVRSLESADGTASVDRNPKGEDPQGLSAEHESAVGEAETPNPCSEPSP